MSSNLIAIDGEDAIYTSSADVVMVRFSIILLFVLCYLLHTRKHFPTKHFQYFHLCTHLHIRKHIQGTLFRFSNCAHQELIPPHNSFFFDRCLLWVASIRFLTARWASWLLSANEQPMRWRTCTGREECVVYGVFFVVLWCCGVVISL